MSEGQIRFAVVGAGVMGANHARTIRANPVADLVAVVDADIDRAVGVTQGAGAKVFSSVDEIDVEFDAAIVAVPTSHHLAAVRSLAVRGVHLLVEKPLALTLDQADEIIEICSTNDLVLAVGHIERFNAAVAELPPLLENPVHIEASRISPYSARVGDGVILDLMIHDIDIVCALYGEREVTHVSGVASSVHGGTEDIASVTMRFGSGRTATFATSRLGQEKIRTIEVTQTDSCVRADLVRQDIAIHRMTRHEYLSDEGMRYRQSSVLEIPFIETRGEPLQRELVDFCRAVGQGVPPTVDGQAGRSALSLALRATEAVRASDRRST